MTHKLASVPLLQWCVYMILCSDNSLYTGITTDINRRFQQHSEGKGARYFRGRTPLQVVYLEGNHSRCSAAVREYMIKRMNRAEKEFIVASYISGMQKTPTAKEPAKCNSDPGSGNDTPPC